MEVTNEFKAIINEDISRCEHEYKSGNSASVSKLHSELNSKYASIIDSFKDGQHILYFDEDGTLERENLEIMRQKLILFRAMGHENKYAAKEASGTEVTVNNTNQFSTSINISFSDAKSHIENMSSLRETEIEEITSKIDELEKIVNSKERKTKKWEMATEIIKWLADKSVDVGITLLPLLLKINQ